MSEKLRYVVLGLGIMVAVGVGTYVGWSALSGGDGPSEQTGEEGWDESWTASETEAEAESPTADRADRSKVSETSDQSEESDASGESETSDTEKKAAESGEEKSEKERKVAEAKSDETATVPTSIERVDESTDQVARQNLPGQQNGQGEQERKEYKPAVLQIVTNFSKADATVNGLPYPEYKVARDGEEDGMVLPAGGPYTVEVTYDGKKKTYTISLRPYEVRVLMVELTGFKGGKPSGPETTPQASNNTANARPDKKNDSEEKGRVTVYSKPKGTIQVDGETKEQKTPGTVEVSPGQHDIQVKFDDGKMSESKTVRVRKGSRIKLFFRKK